MKTMPDYTEYLDTHFDITDKAWLKTGHEYQANVVIPVIEKYSVKSVLEIGCGSGHLAKLIPQSIKYIGFDKSLLAIKSAKSRRPSGTFITGDIREAVLPHADLTVSWSFMKHFGLNEWKEVLEKILKQSPITLFSMPISSYTHDDGIDFPHVWVTEDYLLSALKEFGQKVINVDKSTVEWVILCALI
jgi:SAM-dependent methyltransferase